MFATSRAKAAASLALSLVCGAAMGATTCSLAAGNLAFGSYDVFNLYSLDSSTSLIVTCHRAGGPQHTTVSIGIGPSASSNSVQDRRMNTPAGPEFMRYNLYRDANRTSIWGNTPGVDTHVQVVSVPNNGSVQLPVPIYGRIPPRQDLRTGNYTDSVSVTVAP